MFCEIRLLLLVECDSGNYHNFFGLSDDRYFMIIAKCFAWSIIAIIADLYKIDRFNPEVLTKCILQNILQTRGPIACFAVLPQVFHVNQSMGLVQYLGGGVEGTGRVERTDSGEGTVG
jgi:hypothetical protein